MHPQAIWVDIGSCNRETTYSYIHPDGHQVSERVTDEVMTMMRVDNKLCLASRVYPGILRNRTPMICWGCSIMPLIPRMRSLLYRPSKRGGGCPVICSNCNTIVGYEYTSGRYASMAPEVVIVDESL